MHPVAERNIGTIIHINSGGDGYKASDKEAADRTINELSQSLEGKIEIHTFSSFTEATQYLNDGAVVGMLRRGRIVFLVNTEFSESVYVGLRSEYHPATYDSSKDDLQAMHPLPESITEAYWEEIPTYASGYPFINTLRERIPVILSQVDDRKDMSEKIAVLEYSGKLDSKVKEELGLEPTEAERRGIRTAEDPLFKSELYANADLRRWEQWVLVDSLWGIAVTATGHNEWFPTINAKQQEKLAAEAIRLIIETDSPSRSNILNYIANLIPGSRQVAIDIINWFNALSADNLPSIGARRNRRLLRQIRQENDGKIKRTGEQILEDFKQQLSQRIPN